MKKFQMVLKLAVVMCCLQPLVLVAAPIINIHADTKMVTITPQGANTTEVLQALADKAGFKLIGALEGVEKLSNAPIQNNLNNVIDYLVKPQSTVVIYNINEKGLKYISSIELLPTGNEDTKYAIQASDGARPLVGSQKQIEKRMAKNERREKKRAKKIADGTLIWTPEGRKKLKERNQKLREEGQVK